MEKINCFFDFALFCVYVFLFTCISSLPFCSLFSLVFSFNSIPCALSLSLAFPISSMCVTHLLNLHIWHLLSCIYYVNFPVFFVFSITFHTKFLFSCFFFFILLAHSLGNAVFCILSDGMQYATCGTDIIKFSRG